MRAGESASRQCLDLFVNGRESVSTQCLETFADAGESVSRQCLDLFADGREVHAAPNKARHAFERR